MKKIISAGLTALAFSIFLTAAASAQNANCLSLIDSSLLCPPPLGSVLVDQMGNFVCGPGQCAVDSRGKVMCSSKPGGAVALNMRGEVLCVGGCVMATNAMCERPTK